MIYNIKNQDKVKKKWYEPSSPDEIRPIPWLAPIVIQYLEEIIQPDFEVLEHGSGGSTLWLAERCKFVKSYEKNLEWFEYMCKVVPSNVEMTISGNFLLQDGKGFDLVLIDGEPVKERAFWISTAIVLAKSNGWVVLDNANRKEYRQEREYLQRACKSFETFDCNDEGRTKYLVTEFYRMK